MRKALVHNRTQSIVEWGRFSGIGGVSSSGLFASSLLPDFCCRNLQEQKSRSTIHFPPLTKAIDNMTMSLHKPRFNNMYSSPPTSTTSMKQLRKPGVDRRTVAYAVNYEPSMVERFLASTSVQSKGEGGFGPPLNDKNGASTPSESKAGSVVVEDDELSTENNPGNASGSTSRQQQMRRSTREKQQRVVTMTPAKVRYDMDSVPLVDRPKMSFWEDVKVWPPRALKDPPSPVISSTSKVIPARAPNTVSKHPTPVPPANPPNPNSPLPNSVLWKPAERKDWEDSVGEMTAVCTSAALRKHSGPAWKFAPPLSKEYIRDRIDIDDPLRGYQIRHATGGWLQGFCLWTNFTTWTHHFNWDSLHPASGIESCVHVKDAEGSLAKELQNLPRSGSPTDAGIVFEQIAEIALLGGLGCGELMLRMALEDILAHQSQYKYVVLQATNGSRAFYERFGFRRVGATCRYSTDSATATIVTPAMNNENAVAPSNTQVALVDSDDSSSQQSRDPANPSDSIKANPIQGYRHWTHHNESQHSLDLHGGPSYMMCLRLPEEPVEGLNLLERLQEAFVAEKPRVQPIGGGTTPTSKRKLKRQSSVGNFASTPPLAPTLSSDAPNMENIGSSKRRKVSMDRLDLGESASLAHYGLAKGAGSSRKTTTKSRSRPSEASLRAAIETTDLQSRPQALPTKGVQRIDRANLIKQKVKSYPRDRVHFYNKVVKPVGKKNGPYFFCLHYDERSKMVTLCPLEPRGMLSGKRAGRPRYQCALHNTSDNWITAPSSLYQAVPAFMVMKTPLICQEAWDINVSN